MRTIRTRQRRAFTLLEVLVAVGAVALIGVGLAKIFAATSQTVRVGRRISAFSDQARAIERQMREDFRRITREGYLVIAHELTEDPVRVYPTDPRPRQRRIDQIMFFNTGRFQTQRPALYPTRVASSGEAVVYYGHGLRQEPGTPNIAVPALDDQNRDTAASPSGQRCDLAPAFGQPGPNELASDWILLRRVALLAQPKAKSPPYPTGLLFPTAQEWDDSDIQVDLAPAQSSLFRNLARGTPDALPGAVARPGDTVARPLLSSGIPDIITTDLREIRAIVLDAQRIPSANPAMVFNPNPTSLADDPDTFRNPDTNRDVRIDYAFQVDTTPGGSGACNNMKQWMLQGLPAEPQRQTTNSGASVPTPSPAPSMGYGGRIRCEPAPPDLIGAQAYNGQVAYVGTGEFRRADQIMLGAGNLAPACTEFIVEWSFGETYKTDYDPVANGQQIDPFLTGPRDPRADQLIWHGLPRLAKTDFSVPGLPSDPNDRIAGPYYGKFDTSTVPGAPAQEPIDAHYQPITLTDGTVFVGPLRRAPSGAIVNATDGRVLPRVIHEPVDSQGVPDPRPGEPFYSVFGYVDPTFPGPDLSAPEGDPRRKFPQSIPCAWPRLIRITMTLADPADPSREQTFQFVFEIPDQAASGG